MRLGPRVRKPLLMSAEVLGRWLSSSSPRWSGWASGVTLLLSLGLKSVGCLFDVGMVMFQPKSRLPSAELDLLQSP
jgi:hypothetical protein